MSRSDFVVFSRRMSLLVSMVACSPIQAQPASVRVVNGQKLAVPWESMVDQVVSIDGIPWGGAAKGFGHYVSSPTQNAPIQVDHEPMQFEGHLVRVTGVLRRQRIEAAAPDAQGPAEPVEFYVIKSFSIEPIKKVERDQMLPVAEDWIYVGMDRARALELIRARQLSEAHLATESPRDGAEDFAYMIGEDGAITFDVLENKVVRMATVKFHPEGKRLNQWTDVAGYPLPPPVEESGVPAKAFRKELP